MKFLISILAITVFSTTLSAKSDLVDVSKDSKLSDYFKKINSKLSNNSEDASIEGEKTEKGKSDLAEEEILLKEATAKKEESTSLTPFQKMIFAVVGILALGLVIVVSLQKFSNKNGHTVIAKNITVLTQKSLGPKKNLTLIRVAGETILLGVTDHNINHIKTLSLMDDEIPDFTEPKFSKQLKDKIVETKRFDEQVIDPMGQEDAEEIDGYSVSRLDDVKKAITKRFSV